MCFCDCEPIATICKRRVRTAHLISETNKQYQTVTEARQLVRSAHPTKSISVHCAPYLGNKQTLGGHNVRSKQ